MVQHVTFDSWSFRRRYYSCTPEEPADIYAYTDMRTGESTGDHQYIPIPPGASAATVIITMDDPSQASTHGSYFHIEYADDHNYSIDGYIGLNGVKDGGATYDIGNGLRACYAEVLIPPGARRLRVIRPQYSDPGEPVPGHRKVWFWEE